MQLERESNTRSCDGVGWEPFEAQCLVISLDLQLAVCPPSGAHFSLFRVISLYCKCKLPNSVFSSQNEISYQFSAPRGIPPESPIPEIRIQTELENGTYVTSPVEDSDVTLPPPIGHRLPTITITSDQIQPVSTANGHPLHSLPATNGHPMPSSNGHPLTSSNGRALPTSQPLSSTASTRSHHNTNTQRSPAGTTQKSSHSGRIREGIEHDPPPPYPMSESPGGAAKTRSRQQNSTSSPQHASTNHSQYSLPRQPPATATGTGAHSVAKKTTSSKAKAMDNNLYRAVVLEGFQGISGKVTTV